jgi:pimeloyl-ACP methyl ester carboxylesterase
MMVRGVAANPWTVAHQRAAMTGTMLADIMARTNEDKFVLVGHSLGARVMVMTAQALGSDRLGEPLIESMHLLGAAVANDGDWQQLDAAVSDKIWNCWSRRDRVLKFLYRSAQIGARASGQTGFDSKFASINDRDVSRSVASHSDYIANVTLR